MKMTDIFLLCSISINLIFCAIVTTLLMKVPLNLDKIRNDYLQNVRLYYNRGCVNAAREYVRSTEPVIGFDTHSPMSWCADQTREMEDIFMNDLFKIGR